MARQLSAPHSACYVTCPVTARAYTQDMNRIFAEQLKDWRGDMLV
jgi:hypothetical protein